MTNDSSKNRIFAIDVSALSDPAIFDACYKAQRPDRRERIDKMRFDSGKRLSLGAGVVMEHALSFAGCSARDIVITPQGKPTVKGCSFNLSHTADIAVCAISDLEVGIDIERPRTLSDAVIKRAFTPHEIEMVGDDTERFIRLWTIKESVMKWYGLGLGLMPEHINITVSEDIFTDLENSGSNDVFMTNDIRIDITDHPELASRALGLFFSTYNHEDYRITVCSEYEKFAESITWINPAL